MNISIMVAGKRGETNAALQIITHKVTGMPVQSILKYIVYCIYTIWNSSAAFS